MPDPTKGLPPHLDRLSPLISRHANSILQLHEPHPDTSNTINTQSTEVFGNPDSPLGFRLGNGGAGYTGLLKTLCDAFISLYPTPFHIDWVSNHSRHSHIALLADIVQVALTYEPDWEDFSIEEGWAAPTGLVLNDGFLLVGPTTDPAELGKSGVIRFALRKIARHGYAAGETIMHTRGDGSATHYKELELWALAGVDLADSPWRVKQPCVPRDALVEANQQRVYLLTDRATFLTAMRDNLVPNLTVFCERSAELINPCSALINIKAPKNKLANEFAEWLVSEHAQTIIEDYGKDWPIGLPLFAGKDKTIMDGKYAMNPEQRRRHGILDNL